MSNIDGLSISISVQPSSLAAPVQPARVGRTAEHDGDGDEGRRVRHGHGHGDSHGQGSLQSALMQALQSLGLTGSSASTSTTTTTTVAPTGSSATSTTTPVASAPATDQSAAPGNTVSASDTLKADIRSFMQALFQAVRAAQPASSSPGPGPSPSPSTSTSTSTSTSLAGSAPDATAGGATPTPPVSGSTVNTAVATDSGATTAPVASPVSITIHINMGTQSAYGERPRFGEHQGHRMQFASGLGAVISQVSNNQALAPLQDAFARIVADLQPAAPSSGAGDAGTGAQVTLQALLTQLQQNLGYGAAGNTSALGNLVSAHA
jgi:hypothetical protein